MASRITYIPDRVIDTNGIADGASLYVYQTGTTAKISLFSDEGLTVPVTNPYVVVSGAKVPSLYHNYSGHIRMDVVSSGGAIDVYDPYERPVSDVELSSSSGAGKIGIEGGGDTQQAIDAVAIEFADIAGKTFGAGVQQLRVRDRGDALMIDATGESLESDQEGETWSDTSSGTRQMKLGAPSIMRRLPTWQLPALGTATQNRQMLNRAVQYLEAEGGVELQLVSDEIEIDGPIITSGKISLIGPGSRDCLLRNTASYAFRRSAIFQPGNFHLDATEEFFGHASTHALDAIVAGDLGVDFTTPADISGYNVGDQVVVFDSVYYLASSLFKCSHYLALATVVRISGGTLYLDRPIRDNIASPLIHNLTTTTINGFDPITNAQTQKLFAVRQATYAGFSVDTPGYWIADSATQDCIFEDIRLIQSRAGPYGNTHQRARFKGIRGVFGIHACELSHNSEDVVVEDFDLTFDPSMGLTPLYFVSWQENGLDCTMRHGRLDLGSYASNVPVLAVRNHTRSTFEDMRIDCAGAYSGTVLTIGDVSPASGRRVTTDARAARIKWSGACGYYYRLIGSETRRTVVEDCEFYGTVATLAVSLEDTAYLNTVRNDHFDQGRLALETGVSFNQHVHDSYFGGGITALTGTDYSNLINNTIHDNRSAKTAARRKAKTMLAAQPAAFTGTTAEQTILSADIGAGGLQRQDVLEVMIRANITGTAGTKTFSLKVNDLAGPTERTALTWTVASGTTGVVVLTGTLTLTSTTLMIAEGLQQIGTTSATPTNGSITTDYSALDTQIELALTLASGADSVTIAAARMDLRNEYQL